MKMEPTSLLEPTMAVEELAGQAFNTDSSFTKSNRNQYVPVRR
jgi:hypothetical protein